MPLLFFQGELYEKIIYDVTYRLDLLKNRPDIYNRGILFFPRNKLTHWFRCDLTPMLIEEVPKEIRLQALLLTGES